MAQDSLWGWDDNAKKWVKLQVDENGFVKVDMSEINLNDLANVNAPTPSDNEALTWDAATSKWIAEAPIPAAHNLGGAKHNASTLANLNTKVSDATLKSATAISLEIDTDINTHADLPSAHHASIHQVARKPDHEQVYNSSTLQDDDDLYFAVAAYEVWQFFAYIIHNTGATPDIKFAWAVPAAGSIYIFDSDEIGVLTANTPLAHGDGTIARFITGFGALRDYAVWGYYFGGANAGNVQLQWAQFTADTSYTRVIRNSFIVAHKLA